MSSVLVAFEGAWLCEVANPAVTVHASFPERGQTTTAAGEVRHYAGGRARVITTASKSATFPLTLQLLTDADLALLESWQGRLLLLRDGSGRREFGTYFSLDVEDLWDPDGTLHSVGFTFSRLTYSEEVL